MPSEIGIRELNNRLSEVISAARGGAELTITSHGRPVARLGPLAADDPLERLRAQGLLSEPSEPDPAIDDEIEAWEPIPFEGSVSGLVREQRR